MATTGTAEFRSKNETKSYSRAKSSIGFSRPSVARGLRRVPVEAFGCRRRAPVDPYDTCAYDRSHRNNRAGETFELEAFKKHRRLGGGGAETTRREATLRGFRRIPRWTMHIRALEEENAKVKNDLSRERRSNSDARVALQSARRQHDTLITEKKVRRNRAVFGAASEPFGAADAKETFVVTPMSPDHSARRSTPPTV